MAKKISYSVRDFANLRQELVNLTKLYYPDLVKNTNDASIFSVLLDLSTPPAAVPAPAPAAVGPTLAAACSAGD